MSKRFLAIIAVGLAIFVGIIIFSNKGAEAPANNATTPTSHVQGAGTSGVTLIEYGDFQCPACGGYFPIVKAVQAKYGDQISFQFRNFPLVSLHRNAMAAHRAAEAADKQNKYWEMHDLLYERQSAWENSNSSASIFEEYATELGLNLTQFKQDVANPGTLGIINADIEQGRDLNIDATPGFVLDGKKLENNPRDLEGFSQLIDAAIAAKQATKQPAQ